MVKVEPQNVISMREFMQSAKIRKSALDWEIYYIKNGRSKNGFYLISPSEMKKIEEEYNIITDENIVDWVNSVLWGKAKEVIFW